MQAVGKKGNIMDRNWYRNVGGKFHMASENWVESGKAACNADIRNPGFVANPAVPLVNDGRSELQYWMDMGKACGHCLKHYNRSR